MFTKRDIYLSLDISEIRAIVNLNLSQNHTVVNRLYTRYSENHLVFDFTHNEIFGITQHIYFLHQDLYHINLVNFSTFTPLLKYSNS